MGLHLTTLAAIIRHAYKGAAAGLGGATVLRMIRGQSNAAGGGTVDNSDASTMRDFGAINPPLRISGVSSGSGNTSGHAWYDLLYLKTGSNGNDITDGAVAGPRAERYLQNAPLGTSGGVSHLLGVALKVADEGYHAGANGIYIVKAASWGQPITEISPYVAGGGGIWFSERLATSRQLRPFIEAEKAAGRKVLHQMGVYVQGEAEADNGRVAGSTTEATMLAWPGHFRSIYEYHANRYGVRAPWVVQQMALEDSYAVAMNAILESVCRYTVPMNVDGSLGATIDNGAGAGRLNECYYLRHNFADTQKHYTPQNCVLLGKAIVELEKRLGTAAGLTGYEVTKVMPQLLDTVTVSLSGSTSMRLQVRSDEAATIYGLAVPAGSAAPSRAAVMASGMSVSCTEDSGTGKTSAATLILTGLSASTSYDFYTVCADPVYGHAGSPVFALTAATAAASATTWDSTIQNGTSNLVYSADKLTVSRNNATAILGTRSVSALAGKSYWEVAPSGSAPSAVGVADASVGGSTSGTAGTNRVGWVGSSIVHSAGTQAMGGTLVATDVVQIAFDATNKLLWMRRNGSGNWNNTAGADPATGVGGLSTSTIATAYAHVSLIANASAAAVARFASAQWAYAAPAGFTQLSA